MKNNEVRKESICTNNDINNNNSKKFLDMVKNTIAMNPQMSPIELFFVCNDDRVKRYIREHYTDASDNAVMKLVRDAERAFCLDAIRDMYDFTYIDTKMPKQAQEGLI